MRITFFYSAKENAIIAAMGDELKPGVIATAMDGTEKAGRLGDGADPMAIIDDVIAQFRANPASVGMYFILKGGRVNEKDASHFTKMASADLSEA